VRKCFRSLTTHNAALLYSLVNMFTLDKFLGAGTFYKTYKCHLNKYGRGQLNITEDVVLYFACKFSESEKHVQRETVALKTNAGIPGIPTLFLHERHQSKSVMSKYVKAQFELPNFGVDEFLLHNTNSSGLASDNPDFRDLNGESCVDWSGFDCKTFGDDLEQPKMASERGGLDTANILLRTSDGEGVETINTIGTKTEASEGEEKKKYVYTKNDREAILSNCPRACSLSDDQVPHALATQWALQKMQKQLKEQWEKNARLQLVVLPLASKRDYDTGVGFKDITTVAHYMNSTLTTLSRTHQNGFSNGDLKDSNIIFDEEEQDPSTGMPVRPLFTDWGSAVHMDDIKLQAYNEWRGTIEYIPPESGLRRLRRKQTDPKDSDIYCMGMILQYVLFSPCFLMREATTRKGWEAYEHYAVERMILMGTTVIGGEDMTELVTGRHNRRKLDQASIDNIAWNVETPVDFLDKLWMKTKKHPRRSDPDICKPKYLNLDYNSQLFKDGMHLLQRMLEVDPANRISAAEALKHPFFGHTQI